MIRIDGRLLAVALAFSIAACGGGRRPPIAPPQPPPATPPPAIDEPPPVTSECGPAPSRRVCTANRTTDCWRSASAPACWQYVQSDGTTVKPPPGNSEPGTPPPDASCVVTGVAARFRGAEGDAVGVAVPGGDAVLHASIRGSCALTWRLMAGSPGDFVPAETTARLVRLREGRYVVEACAPDGCARAEFTAR